MCFEIYGSHCLSGCCDYFSTLFVLRRSYMAGSFATPKSTEAVKGATLSIRFEIGALEAGYLVVEDWPYRVEGHT